MTITNGMTRQSLKVSLGSIAVPVDVLELICKSKKMGETNGIVVKRIVLDWLDLKEEKKDLEELVKWKEKKIVELENLLKEKSFDTSSTTSTSSTTTITNNNNNNESVILKKLWSPQGVHRESTHRIGEKVRS
jgi:hypothetical protein